MSSLDKIYGISLDEYAKIHNTTIEKLITKTKTDIFLLKTRLHHLVWEAEQGKENDELIAEVKRKLERKEKHLERLLRWSEQGEKNER